MNVDIVANEGKNLTIQGSRFYYTNGDYKINVQIVGGADSRSFDLYPGMGFRMDNGERFYGVLIKSENTQAIEIEISDKEVIDNRAVVTSAGEALPVVVTGGSIDLNGLLQLVNNGGSLRNNGVIAVAANTATQLRAQNADRLKVAFHFPDSVYIGKDNTVNAGNGFPMSGNSKWVDENTAAIWVFCTVGTNIPYFEDLK